MSQEQLFALYMQLTGDLRSLWFAFGGLTVVIAGWLLSRKQMLRASQRIALSIGWLSATGYLGSALTSRYRLLAAVATDIGALPSQSGIARAIGEGKGYYEHASVFVFGALGAISVAAMVLIWTNVAVQIDPSPPK